MERHGDKPEVLAFDAEEQEIEELLKLISEFHQGEYNALGILTRTNPEAEALYEKLKERGNDVNLILPDSKSFHNGCTVMSVQMSKGLEFDEVIIPSAQEETYHTDFDRNILYVACTRAMHKLILTCTGQPSHLLPKE